ncbi:hypothetical protein BMS3Abin06_02573 [bacterium BMS3Abin06]|nr:hypothetical protein BMS3Abin06_02573 [bacterium BMS3Abin06]
MLVKFDVVSGVVTSNAAGTVSVESRLAYTVTLVLAFGWLLMDATLISLTTVEEAPVVEY